MPTRLVTTTHRDTPPTLARAQWLVLKTNSLTHVCMSALCFTRSARSTHRLAVQLQDTAAAVDFTNYYDARVRMCLFTSSTLPSLHTNAPLTNTLHSLCHPRHHAPRCVAPHETDADAWQVLSNISNNICCSLAHSLFFTRSHLLLAAPLVRWGAPLLVRCARSCKSAEI